MCRTSALAHEFWQLHGRWPPTEFSHGAYALTADFSVLNLVGRARLANASSSMHNASLQMNSYNTAICKGPIFPLQNHMACVDNNSIGLLHSSDFHFFE